MKKQIRLDKAVLPQEYSAYVFDLYGTLVDIHTDEGNAQVWEKLAAFYGFYEAYYEAEELRNVYGALVSGKEKELKLTLEGDPRYSHEASPEIEITEVFTELFRRKGIDADTALAVHAGQFFRILTTEYVKLYEGTGEMLQSLRDNGKKVYLLSNAQRIFTAYEMNLLGITKYFDGIMISSDFKTKKPDKRFFDFLVERYQLNPKETLFIGNDSRSDIGGAQTVDFATYYVKSEISPQGDMSETADYVVADFVAWDYQ